MPRKSDDKAKSYGQIQIAAEERKGIQNLTILRIGIFLIGILYFRCGGSASYIAASALRADGGL